MYESSTPRIDGVCGVCSWGEDDDEADEVVRMVSDRGRDMGGVLGTIPGESCSGSGLVGCAVIWVVAEVILTGMVWNR